jgi:uracil phosphoribosyltransferase
MPGSHVTVVDHPAVAHRLAELRDASTETDRFRTVMREISTFVAYEALRGLATRPRQVVTPIGPASVAEVTERVLIVPILRAGLGMVDGIQAVVPATQVAHLGMRRNEETLDAVTYLDGLPADLAGRWVVVCDPMLATGGSLAQACRLVVGRGATQVTALCLLASAPGVARFTAEFPDIHVACAALDAELDHRGYIVPGLGDAGDRLFGPPPVR